MLTILLSAGFLYSCTEGMGPLFGNNALVDAIEAALDKEEISLADLPESAQEVLTSEYGDYAIIRILSAPDQGFQVDLQRTADLSETSAFFDTEGEELECNPERRGRRGRRGGLLRGECFDVTFPIDLVMPDESTITITGEEDFGLVKAWYEANPDAGEKPEPVFPIEVTDQAGEVISITSMEELRALQEECRPNGRRCFRLAFPHSVTMPDGSTITLNSEDDKEQVKAWYEANPDATDRPTLVFPVTVEYQDGSTATANSEEELIALREACE
ncbi:MAG TPA: hypothetical protein DCR93_03750 [Cytophagales bacterium]|nr:hypothetical protein [Cytophagales bacterium]